MRDRSHVLVYRADISLWWPDPSGGWEGKDGAGQFTAYMFSHLDNTPFCSRSTVLPPVPREQSRAERGLTGAAAEVVTVPSHAVGAANPPTVPVAAHPTSLTCAAAPWAAHRQPAASTAREKEREV